jgi:hypothetical protein
MQAQGLVEEMLFNERGGEQGDYQGSTYTYSNLKMSPLICSTDLILQKGCHSNLSLQGTSVSLNTSTSSTTFALEIMEDIIRIFLQKRVRK